MLAEHHQLIVEDKRVTPARGAQVLLTPELALCGYPPEDLLLRPDFYRACQRALDDLIARVGDIAVIVGHPEEHQGERYNAATVIQNGRKIAVYRKISLPNARVDALRDRVNGRPWGLWNPNDVLPASVLRVTQVMHRERNGAVKPGELRAEGTVQSA